MSGLNDLETWTLEYAALDEKLEKIEDEMDLLRVKKHELRLERDELGYEIGRTDFDENGMISDWEWHRSTINTGDEL